jgi:hypothetical protein
MLVREVVFDAGTAGEERQHRLALACKPRVTGVLQEVGQPWKVVESLLLLSRANS